MYIRLLISLKFREKRKYIQHLIRSIIRVSNGTYAVLFASSSLFKMLCSFLAASILKDMLRGVSVQHWFHISIILLMYLSGQEIIKDNERFYAKNGVYFLLSAKTRWSFFIRSLLLPSCVSLIFKLDIMFPFVVILVKDLGLWGGVYSAAVLGAVLLNRCWLLAKKADRFESSAWKTYLYRFLPLLIIFIVFKKLYTLTAMSVDTLKKLLASKNYELVNSQFEKELADWQAGLLRLPFSMTPNLLGSLALSVILLVLFWKGLQLFLTVDRLYYNKPHALFRRKTKQVSSGYLIRKLENTPAVFYLKGLAKNSSLSLVNLLTDQMELFVFYYTIFLVMQKTADQSVNTFILIVGFVIANANMVTSFVLKHSSIFRNNYDLDQLMYWKLSRYTITDMYRIKLDLLATCLKLPALEQLTISYVASLFCLPNALYASVLHLILLLLITAVLKFNCELSTFMVPYLFTKNYPLLKKDISPQLELELYSKLYNLYKFPMVAIFLGSLVTQLFLEFFSYHITVFLLVLLILYMLYVKREMRLLVAKGEALYEKTSL